MMLKAILFDLGGTLLHYHDPELTDNARPFRRVTLAGFDDLLDALEVTGTALPPRAEMHARLDEQIRQSYLAGLDGLRGGSVEAPMRAALAGVGVTLDEATWAEVRRHFYRRIDEIVSPRVGMVETLAALRERGYKLGLISNTYWAADLHDRHLEEHGLLDLLPLRVYSCDTPYRKPHPAIFRTALDALGVQPEEAAYVGDRLDVDVAGAQSAGMVGVLIRSPYQPQGSAPADVTPDIIIDELPDLPPALAALEKSRA